MAIAFDNAVAGGSGTNLTQLAWNHTCAAGNPILFVAAASAAQNNITGVTYNGVSLTQIDTEQGEAGTAFVRLYYLLNPPTGSSLAVHVNATAVDTLSGMSASYTGAKQSGVPDAHAGSLVSAATSISETITVVASNCWVVFVTSDSVDGSGWTYTNVTNRVQNTGEGFLFNDSNAAVASGSFTGTVTSGVAQSQDWAGIMLSFAPFVAAQVPINNYYQPIVTQ